MLFNWLTLWAKKRGLRVLMYHKFSQTHSDYLTVTAVQFAQQLAWLKANNYQFVNMSTVLTALENKISLPPKAVLITFDDAYISQMEIAVPILQQYHACATIFVPTLFVGDASRWDGANAEAIMSLTSLKHISNTCIELGLHTHSHTNFKILSVEQMTQEIAKNIQFFKKNNLPFVPAFAYAYGARPTNAEVLRAMFRVFEQWGIKAAFRIGNRINQQPIRQVYEMQRLDVRGSESFEHFCKKVCFGKLF